MKAHQLLYVLVFIWILLLSSCECLEQVKGVVIDAQTKKPIHKVKLYAQRRVYRQQLSDSLGHFSLSFISGFFEKNGCKDTMLIIALKPGYDSLAIKIKNNSQDTLYLMPTKKN